MEDMSDAAGVPVVAALVEACKPFIKDHRFWPFVSVGLGVAYAVVLALTLATPRPIALTVLSGIVTGLAASGLYSGIRVVKG